MLTLYRQALRIRRAKAELGDGSLSWLEAPEGVLAFERGGGFVCVLNLSSKPVALPPHNRILLSSVPLLDELLPTDAAVWLSVGGDRRNLAMNTS
jgi:alpha-glucosidase